MTYNVSNDFLDTFEGKFGPVARGLGRLIRPSIIAPEGHTFTWVDWSAIEARVLPWLADSRGAEKVLDIFRSNDKDPSAPDIYKIEAANIFNKPATEINKGPERQTGKVAVLSLGFGGSIGALMAMATGYGIYLTEAEAQVIVDKWRENNKWAVTFWGKHTASDSVGVWGAVCSALSEPNVPHKVGRVAYVFVEGYLGGSLACVLPCGRTLWYPKIRWGKVEEEFDGEVRKIWQLTCAAGYGRKKLWRGVFVENITQAAAASLLRGKMVQAREFEDWCPQVGHTHDEGVFQHTIADTAKAVDTVSELFGTNDAWNEGLPLASEATTNWAYTKSM